MRMLKHLSLPRLSVLLVFAAITAVVVPALSSLGDQDFTLHNKTGMTINELYISPAKSDDWGKDILGEGTLDAGKVRTIKFKATTKTAVWDIMMVDENNKKHKFFDKNLTEFTDMTVTANDKGWFATYECKGC